MRKCLRCGTEMKENCAIKVEGAGYGIIMSSDENKLFGGRMGKPKDGKWRLYEMKKILSVFLMSFIVFALSACNADVVKIEDYEWKMRTVMSNDTEAAQYQDELVVAVGEADELYPEAEIVDLTLTAKDGEITITDNTNGKTYNGTYEVMQKTPKGTDYEIIIDGVTGYATVSPTEYYDETEIPTLPINIDGYSLYFIPKE